MDVEGGRRGEGGKGGEGVDREGKGVEREGKGVEKGLERGVGGWKEGRDGKVRRG